MALTLLISSEEVKTLQGLNKNIEDRKLSKWIIPAQMALRSAIGKDGYDAILAEAAAPDADYEALASHFDARERVELTLTVTTINAWNRFAIGFAGVYG